MLAVYIILAVILVFAALYVFALKGRRGAPLLNKLKAFDYAHRGLHSKPEIPENSLKAFKLAAEKGYGAELDVHLLKDGTLAVIHDSLLVRTTGKKGRIEDLTLADLKNYRLEGTDEVIPTLQEVLNIFEGKAPLIIELKPVGNHKALSSGVNEALKDYKGDYCIESFDPRCLYWFKKNAPETVRGQLAHNFFKDKSGLGGFMDFVLTALILSAITRPDFIAYKYTDIKNIPFRISTGLWGVQPAAWTVCDIENHKSLKDKGYIIIFENYTP